MKKIYFTNVKGMFIYWGSYIIVGQTHASILFTIVRRCNELLKLRSNQQDIMTGPNSQLCIQATRFQIINLLAYHAQKAGLIRKRICLTRRFTR